MMMMNTLKAILAIAVMCDASALPHDWNKPPPHYPPSTVVLVKLGLISGQHRRCKYWLQGAGRDGVCTPVCGEWLRDKYHKEVSVNLCAKALLLGERLRYFSYLQEP